MMRRVVLMLLLLAAPAHASTLDERFSDAARENRAVELFRQLRCVVCEGQSIHESNAPLAADMRALVRQRIEEGLSDAQILALMQERYGDKALMRPPENAQTWLLWYGPPLFFLLLILGYMLVWKQTRRA